MGRSSRVLVVGLVLLVIAGGAAFWLLPASGDSSGAVSPVTVARAPVAGAPGFDGQAPETAPREASPLQPVDDAPAPSAPAAGSAAAAMPAAAPHAPVRITGRVLDETGRPVRGATVTFLEDLAPLLLPREEGRERLDKAPTAETGVDGRFSLAASVVADGAAGETADIFFDTSSRLAVRHEQFATLLHSCGAVAPGELDVGDLQLEPGAWVLGRVVDSAGRALSGAEVRARNDEGRNGGRRGGRNGPGLPFGGNAASTLDAVTTGPDGRFAVHGLHAGKAELTARRDGLRLGSVADLELEARIPKDVGDIVLEAGVAISGVVVAPDGAALAGAEVSVSSMTRLMVNRIEDLPRAQVGQEFGQRATSGADGRFEVSGLAGGTYTVHVRADGYAPLSREDVPAGTGNLRLQPVRLGALLLTILDASSGDAVPGARIKATPTGGGDMPFMQLRRPLPVLAGADALAAAGNRVTSPPAEAAAYLVRDAGVDGTNLVIAAAHYATQQAEAPPVGSDEILPFVVRLVPESMVSGLVVDEARQPVDGATVTLSKAPIDSGDPSGRFTGRFEQRIMIGDGGPGEALNAESMTARTGADGRFELRGAAAGSWRLEAEARGFVSSEPQDVALGEAKPQPELTIVLRQAGSIAGVVTEADGTPAADVQVRAVPRVAPDVAPDNSPGADIERQVGRFFGGGGRNGRGGPDGARSARTGSDGRYVVEGLPEGDYGVSIASGPRRGRSFGPAMVFAFAGDGGEAQDAGTIWTRVAAGAESRVDLVRPRRGAVTGTVVAGGAPAAGVSVSLRPQAMPFFGGERTDTDAHGAFRFEDVEAGSYTLSAQPAGAALEETAAVSLDPGQERRVDLVFSGSTLSGRVVEAGSDKSGEKGAASVRLSLRPVKEAAAGEAEGQSSMALEMVMVTSDGRGAPGGLSMSIGGGRGEVVNADADGNFTLHWVKPGRYELEASGAGYTPGSIGPFEVTEGENRSDLHVEVTRGAVVEGLVVSGATGERLDKVPVRLESDGDQQMTVTQDGTYRFDGLQPGEYTVDVLGSGFMSEAIASEKVTIEKNGEVHKLDLTTKQS